MAVWSKLGHLRGRPGKVLVTVLGKSYLATAVIFHLLDFSIRGVLGPVITETVSPVTILPFFRT